MFRLSIFSPNPLGGQIIGSIDTAHQFRDNKNKPRTQSFRQNFTTAQARIDVSQRMGMNYIKAVVDNQDPTNNLTVRTDPDAEVLTVPPNSVIIIEDEIHSYIEINPNAVTGVGNFSLTLADPIELRNQGFLGGVN